MCGCTLGSRLLAVRFEVRVSSINGCLEHRNTLSSVFFSAKNKRTGGYYGGEKNCSARVGVAPSVVQHPWRTCPRPWSPPFTRGPVSRLARTIWPHLSHAPDRAGGEPRSRFIDIPEPVLEKYLIWRPTPLYRAYGLEKYLKTPARIYFKNEGVSPAGSHKPNTAMPQAYYNKISGTKTHHHRDRRRPVGKRPLLCLCLLRAGVQGLHGEDQLSTRSPIAGS